MTRGRRGRSPWGSVTEIQRGRKYRLRWWADTPQGRRRCTETFEGTRRQADRRLAQIRLSQDESRAPTVGEVWEGWYLGWADGSVAPTTMDRYRQAWESRVRDRWADVPLTQVRAADVQRWLDGIPGGAAATCLTVMRNVFKCAIMYDLADHDPTRAQFRMPQAARPHEKTVWSLAQVEELGRLARGEWWEAAFILCAHAGLRVGEALGVRVGEVARAEVAGVPVAQVPVCRTVDQNGGVAERVKTRGSAGTVTVTEPWATRLLEIQDEAAAAGYAWLADNGLGDPHGRRAVGYAWERTLRENGIAYAPFRNLRNSYATSLHWEAGMPIEKASKALRHAQVSTTLAHYDRPRDEYVAQAVAEASERIARAAGVVHDVLANCDQDVLGRPRVI